MRTLYLLAFFLLFSTASFAQLHVEKAIYYFISFPNAVHHEAEISITVPQAPGTLRLHISQSSAGRYTIHQFGKNIYNLKATNVDGTSLTINQVDADTYEIPNHEETVKITYTLFADLTDGTYSSVDASHAHLNMPATIIWIEGQDKRQLRVQFNDIDKYGWKAATQLKNEGDNVYSAPTLQYLMDSPVELSNYKTSSWDIDNNGQKEKINLIVHSNDDQGTVDNFAKKVQRLVPEEKAVFGELPAYDYGEYTFLTDVDTAADDDGMEHRNSTCITYNFSKIAGNELGLLSTFSHEFFHSWNVKRIRPKSLEPFDFTHVNLSSDLWFAEGFTQYYGEMLLTRSGLQTLDQYNATLGKLLNRILNEPAAAKYPAVQMSRYAVFYDGGVYADPTNKANIFTSYYYYGDAIALALDLRLRSEFNLTLDDYMKAVWQARGKVMKPYTIADLQADLAKLTKNSKFASDFFNNYINGTDKNNYEALLAKAGLLLRKANPGKAWAGHLSVKPAQGGLTIDTSTIVNTPIYNAGLDAGDVILKADGKTINDIKVFTDIVSAKRPGDKIVVNYHNRTGEHETTITLEEDPALEVVTYEKAGKTPTKEQSDFRSNWLSSKAK